MMSGQRTHLFVEDAIVRTNEPSKRALPSTSFLSHSPTFGLPCAASPRWQSTRITRKPVCSDKVSHPLVEREEHTPRAEPLKGKQNVFRSKFSATHHAVAGQGAGLIAVAGERGGIRTRRE